MLDVSIPMPPEGSITLSFNEIPIVFPYQQ
jgi:hypothetical protein